MRESTGSRGHTPGCGGRGLVQSTGPAHQQTTPEAAARLGRQGMEATELRGVGRGPGHIYMELGHGL